MSWLEKLTGRQRRRRVVVIGLDGVPQTFLVRLMDGGVMPHLAALRAQGEFRQMDAPLPEVSSVSWTAFMTGTNSGENGIFGFMDLEPGSYRMYFPNSRHIKSPPLWQQLGNGHRSVVLNLPSTYPATPLNGVMVSGFVALDLDKASYPASIVPYLKQIGYRIDVDSQKGRAGTAVLLEDVRATLAARAQALDHFWQAEDWDLFIGIITETDRLQHFLWSTAQDPAAPHHDEVLDVYRRVDDVLAGLIERARALGPETLLVLMSDHGFTSIVSEVYLNRWLVEQGWLTLPAGARNLDGISPTSKAFALDPSRIYIHLRGRYPRGTVAPGADYDQVCGEISERLLQLSYEGQPVVRRVFRRDEIYHGPHVGRAPDLVVLAHHGFDLKGALDKPSVFGRSHFTGGHTQDDAFVFVDGAGGLALDRRPQVADVAPWVRAHLLGSP